ncbi:DNA gyrase/topoisomerase IV subunit B [Rhodopirellula rubra]|uniref:DNA topoisomerase (ATP-hydrolyzing) n=1 Tax=Aporhodopirellula rubra TaxID=980271 RepID=A0A7W5E0Q4_9BACT|nr:toprim domain-containing protein [Aporhodopirellula rubra]MBB3207122.1 DNA gyrase/topoisomerase IV subunit B [Aporhodopirellula rubra]
MIAYGRQPTHYPCGAVGAVGSAASPGIRTTVAGTECLIVEGDSAAKSVDQVRDDRFQSILALQGKPLNALKAGREAVSKNEVFTRIFETLLGFRPADAQGADDARSKLASSQQCVYERIILLMDPDADGIHCGVLMMAFFRKFSPDLIRSGRVHVVRPPMFVFRLPGDVERDPSQWPVASSPEHANGIEETLRRHGVTGFQKIRHRGLGSLDTPLLRDTCVDPESRRQSSLTIEEVDSAIAMFGG